MDPRNILHGTFRSGVNYDCLRLMELSVTKSGKHVYKIKFLYSLNVISKAWFCVSFSFNSIDRSSSTSTSAAVLCSECKMLLLS